MLRWQIGIWFGVLALVGCGGPASTEQAAKRIFRESAPTELRKREQDKADPDQARANPMVAGQNPPPPPAKMDIPAERRIIYTATLELVVKDLDVSQTEVRRLVGESGGFIAKSEVHGQVKSQREGQFRLRVPVSHFDSILASLRQLGEPVRDSSDANDVTEEYVDTAARLKALRREEEDLNKLMDKSAGKLEDLIKVRQERERIRLAIESAESRIQVLTKLSDLTTITLHLRELANYVPLTAPTFGTSVSRTFAESLAALTIVGQGVILVVVALVPWLPLLAIAALMVRWFVYHHQRSAIPVAVPSNPLPPAEQNERTNAGDGH